MSENRDYLQSKFSIDLLKWSIPTLLYAITSSTYFVTISLTSLIVLSSLPEVFFTSDFVIIMSSEFVFDEYNGNSLGRQMLPLFSDFVSTTTAAAVMKPLLTICNK